MTDENRLVALDDRFVDIYEAARRQLLEDQKARALIVVDGDSLLLYHGGSEPQVIAGLRPPLYEKLKTLSHVPLAIYCLVVGRNDGGTGLEPPVLSALQDYRQQLRSAAAELDTTAEVETGVLSREIAVLDRALAFLDRIVADGRVSQAGLSEYAHANVADLNACFAAATRVQLDVCHGHMMRLKETAFSAEDWASLRVVVMGPHMAHKDQNFLQYFSRLLHTPKYACKRVVYFEGEDRDGALDLMGTAILDFQASRTIFDDETRLHRDVLADATTRYLDELFPG
jgi:hypothetical protein